MNIRDEIERSIDLIRSKGGVPSKAHRHLLCTMWKGDEAEIEKAIAVIQRAEFFMSLANRGLEDFADRKAVYWELAESKGEIPCDLLENSGAHG